MPKDQIDHRLWAMGFGPDDRMLIIKVAQDEKRDPVALGIFLSCHRSLVKENLKVELSKTAFVNRIFRELFSILKWLASWPVWWYDEIRCFMLRIMWKGGRDDHL